MGAGQILLSIVARLVMVPVVDSIYKDGLILDVNDLHISFDVFKMEQLSGGWADFGVDGYHVAVCQDGFFEARYEDICG